jgi:hypothetical protein
VTMVRDRPSRSSLGGLISHWNYDELDDPNNPCLCVLCRATRETTAASAILRIPIGHKVFTCGCTPCLARRSAMGAEMEAANRRTVYSELAWLTRYRTWREEFLLWLWSKVTDPAWHPPLTKWRQNWNQERSPNITTRFFWMYDVESRPLGWWVQHWHETERSS